MADAVMEFWRNHVPIPIIAKSLKITEERVHQIMEKNYKSR